MYYSLTLKSWLIFNPLSRQKTFYSNSRFALPTISFFHFLLFLHSSNSSSHILPFLTPFYLLLTFYYRLLFALVAELCHSIMPQLQPPSLILKYLLLTFYYCFLFALVAELCSIMPQLQPRSLILTYLLLTFYYRLLCICFSC